MLVALGLDTTDRRIIRGAAPRAGLADVGGERKAAMTLDAPPREPAALRPSLIAWTAAFAAFVTGGLLFGLLFVSNLNTLAQFRAQDRLARPLEAPGRVIDDASEESEDTSAPEAEAVSAAPELPEWTGTERRNILLLGIDHRDDEPIDGSRSDTMLIVSIDPPARAVVMVSLPRDLYVSIPGHPSQRINGAHVLGGPDLAARTVYENFGIPIHNYARIDFRGFERIVDALGGVIVDVERTIKDDEYPTEDYGIMRLFIPPGPQLMNGKLALQYARSRHGENDFSRARRQQRLLLAMRDRGLQLNVLPRIPSLIGLVQQALQTDVGVGDMVTLANLGSKIERDRVKSVVVDTTLADPFVGWAGEDLLEPRRQDVRRAIVRAFAEASGQTARLEVLNGTSRVGIAQQLANQLEANGYDIVRVDPADRLDYRETSIVVLNDNMSAATTLAARLRVPQSAIQVSPVPNGPADIRIIVGANYQR